MSHSKLAYVFVRIQHGRAMISAGRHGQNWRR